MGRKSALICIILIFTSTPAYAYLDPGTGSVVIQALMGVLVGLVITLKIYWSRLKEKISGYSKSE